MSASALRATLEDRRHDHDYVPASHLRGERQTRLVILLTAVMMVVEIAAGSAFNSMALLADGWHMASHASALGITAFAYAYARRRSGDARFSFGTWKVSVLGGYTSAVVLAVIALLIAWEAVGRLLDPRPIRFDEAVLVAVVGLGVNLLSAWLLRDDPSHAHTHGHAHGQAHDHGHAHAHPSAAGTASAHEPVRHHDHNLRAAYLHVLADALTSLTAIAGLLAGKYLDWIWMDAAMGIVGSLVIARWSWGLVRETSAVLLDASVPAEEVDEIRQALEGGDSPDAVADLHVWPVGPGHRAVVASIVSEAPRSPDDFKARLEGRPELDHVTVEVISVAGTPGPGPGDAPTE